MNKKEKLIIKYLEDHNGKINYPSDIAEFYGWDHYETFQWWASNEYARNHPDDPDVPELVERKKHDKEIYLRWGRETLGWAIYLFRKP